MSSGQTNKVCSIYGSNLQEYISLPLSSSYCHSSLSPALLMFKTIQQLLLKLCGGIQETISEFRQDRSYLWNILPHWLPRLSNPFSSCTKVVTQQIHITSTRLLGRPTTAYVSTWCPKFPILLASSDPIFILYHVIPYTNLHTKFWKNPSMFPARRPNTNLLRFHANEKLLCVLQNFH